MIDETVYGIYVNVPPVGFAVRVAVKLKGLFVSPIFTPESAYEEEIRLGQVFPQVRGKGYPVDGGVVAGFIVEDVLPHKTVWSKLQRSYMWQSKMKAGTVRCLGRVMPK